MTTLNVNQFIKDHYYGVLSTHSQTESGFPFGSLTPYIVTNNGDIAIFISHLAEHTTNIQVNPKVSLTIFDPVEPTNPSASARITCLANVIQADDESSLRAIYSAQFPDSAMTLDLPGFHFYLLQLSKVRLVAGFGQVKWLTVEQLNL